MKLAEVAVVEAEAEVGRGVGVRRGSGGRGEGGAGGDYRRTAATPRMSVRAVVRARPYATPVDIRSQSYINIYIILNLSIFLRIK